MRSMRRLSQGFRRRRMTYHFLPSQRAVYFYQRQPGWLVSYLRGLCRAQHLSSGPGVSMRITQSHVALQVCSVLLMY
jgi:hypothetical protein